MKYRVYACASLLLFTLNAWAASPPTPPPRFDGVKHIDVELIGSPPSGTYEVLVEQDGSLPTHTVYRPKRWGASKHPVLVWGNGACSKSGLLFAEFITEIASHGIFVIADGPPIAGEYHGRERRDPQAPPPARPSPGSLKPDGTALIAALDWIEARNSEAGSRYFGKIDMTKVAAMGMSCGGLMAYGASKDKRITSVGIWNSGLLEPNPPIFAALHSPVIIITGGPEDIAQPNGQRDFETLPKTIPVFHAIRPDVGHGGTYSDDNGGAFGKVAVAWLRWQLLNDTSAQAKGLFAGEKCGLCADSQWQVRRRSID
jgi:hypothetical protein